VYYCIKKKSLKKYTTRFYRAPKEVDLTQPKLDHPRKRPHVSTLHKSKRPISVEALWPKCPNTAEALWPKCPCVFAAIWTVHFQWPGRHYSRPGHHCRFKNPLHYRILNRQWHTSSDGGLTSLLVLKNRH